ncbi:MAG: MFS transporter [Gammaproteobacteria bacterium]|nr:MFS transporter [Gammaproteobacteria bacterium]
MAARSAQSIDIGTLIDSRPLSGLQIRTIVLCALVVMLDGFDIQTMALAVPSLTAEWNMPREQFGLALSASLIGLGCGSAFIAPLGDRVGRRPMVLVLLSLVGLASIATGFSSSPTHFVFWRLITGLGLGASITNAIALTSEYMPAARQSFLTTLMFSNIAVGALVAGFIAPELIAWGGWQAVFWAGGALPLILVVMLFFGLQESVRFLLEQRPQDARIRTIVRALAADSSGVSVIADPATRTRRQSIRELLTPEFRLRSLVLWTIFALNMFVMYSLISWLPALLRDEGWTTAQALRGGVLTQLGSVVGGLAMTFLVDRGLAARTLLVSYSLAAMALVGFMVFDSTLLAWCTLIVLVGIGINGSQLVLFAFAAAFYPPAIKATGVGWAIAISRIGAVGGPIVLTSVIAMGLGTASVLGTLIIPTLLCVACVFALPRVLRDAGIGHRNR